jgi:hypothetical protein
MLCKKMFVVFGLMMILPAFATGISPNDTGDNMCVVDVLETYTGPANLTAPSSPSSTPPSVRRYSWGLAPRTKGYYSSFVLNCIS